MGTLLIAVGVGIAYLIAYHTYGRWLGHKIFQLSVDQVCPAYRLQDGNDYVPTPRAVVFGHHFTSIAGTGPIVGPAIAVMWGWLPALLWVVFGSIFIGAVHDLGALVVSLRNNGQTVGDIAGRVLNPRVRVLFLLILFMALTIVLAIFGLVIAAVFRQFPAAIFPCLIQIPLAVGIGYWLHRRGVGLLVPSLLALVVMYVTVIFGDINLSTSMGWLDPLVGVLHSFNTMAAAWPMIVWVILLMIYSYAASVLPVWILLQPRDYINSLQLISALGLIVVGLAAAAFFGGQPLDGGATRPALQMAAPLINLSPENAPMIFPFLFITVACGAISGFHCLVSSGTSSKQLQCEPDARFVGFGAMLTEGFLATLVILACVAGLGLGIRTADGSVLTGAQAWQFRYASWGSAQGLSQTVAAFVDGAANLLSTLGIARGVSVALMGVLVASFAGTTMDTACRLQRYVVEELAGTIVGCRDDTSTNSAPRPFHPLGWLTNKHGATLFAIFLAMLLAMMPTQPPQVSILAAFQGDIDVAVQTAALQTDKLTQPAIDRMNAGGIEGLWAWAVSYGGKGGMILWPMFGATNQLLGGLSFIVVGFYLWRRRISVWFLILPAIFMLVMPAWALIVQLFYGDGFNQSWVQDDRWVLMFIAFATLVLEGWMIIEAVLLLPKVRGIIETVLPGSSDPLIPPTAAAAAEQPQARL